MCEFFIGICSINIWIFVDIVDIYIIDYELNYIMFLKYVMNEKEKRVFEYLNDKLFFFMRIDGIGLLSWLLFKFL